MDTPLPTCNELLDQLRVHLRDPRKPLFTVSDGYIARQLGMTPSSISNVRRGLNSLRDENALKLAELLELDPQYVLACCHLDRSRKNTQNDRVHALWEKIARGVAILLICFSLSAGLSPKNAAAAEGDVNIHYAQGKGRRRSRLLGALEGLLGPFLGLALAATTLFSLPAAAGPLDQVHLSVGLGMHDPAYDWHFPPQNSKIVGHRDVNYESNPLGIVRLEYRGQGWELGYQHISSIPNKRDFHGLNVVYLTVDIF